MSDETQATAVEAMHAALGGSVQAKNRYLEVVRQLMQPEAVQQLQQHLAGMPETDRLQRLVSIMLGDILGGVVLALEASNTSDLHVGAALTQMQLDQQDLIEHPLFLIAEDEDLSSPDTFIAFLDEVKDLVQESNSNLKDDDENVSDKILRNEWIYRMCERLLIGLPRAEEDEEDEEEEATEQKETSNADETVQASGSNDEPTSEPADGADTGSADESTSEPADEPADEPTSDEG